MTPSYYFSGQFASRPYLRMARDYLLERMPEAVVTSRWIDFTAEKHVDYTTADLNDRPGDFAEFALMDLYDLRTADTLISFGSDGGRGGRHVEFGYALALGKRLVLIGQREGIFHTMPEVLGFNSLMEFVDYELKNA